MLLGDIPEDAGDPEISLVVIPDNLPDGILRAKVFCRDLLGNQRGIGLGQSGVMVAAYQGEVEDVKELRLRVCHTIVLLEFLCFFFAWQRDQCIVVDEYPAPIYPIKNKSLRKALPSGCGTPGWYSVPS